MLNEGKKRTARVNDYASADVKASLTRLPTKPKAAANHGRISSLPAIKRAGGRSQTIVKNRFGGQSRNTALVEDNPFTTTNQHHFEEL